MLVVINQVVRDLAVSNVNFQISRYVIESEKLGLGEINAANIQGSFFNLDYCNIMNVLPDHVYYEEGKGWMNEKSEVRRGGVGTSRFIRVIIIRSF